MRRVPGLIKLSVATVSMQYCVAYRRGQCLNLYSNCSICLYSIDISLIESMVYHHTYTLNCNIQIYGSWSEPCKVHAFSSPVTQCMCAWVLLPAGWSQVKTEVIRQVEVSKGWLKSEFVVCVDKIQVQSNKVCYKIYLRENIQRQSCSIEPFTYLTVYRCWW